jgi:multidrug resistance efflux pump
MKGPSSERPRILGALTRRRPRPGAAPAHADLEIFPEGTVLGGDVPHRLVDAIVATPPTARRAGRLLATVLVLGLAATLWLPWQQNIGADGQVVALDPEFREQRITAPVKGRAVRWYVQEGELVEAGQMLVELVDVDPDYAVRLVARKEAVRERINAQERQVAMFEGQVAAFREALAMTKEAVALRVEAAEQKVIAAEQKLRASRVGRRVAELQDKRVRQLQAEGLSSERELELADMQRLTAGNQVGMEGAAVSEARANREAAKADGIRAVSEAEARIASAEASLSKARSEFASAKADMLSVESEIARQEARFVRAPQRSWVVRLAGQRDGIVYDVGEVLAVLAPDTPDRAVALRIAGNDSPIVQVGSRVQLQFEGWPAVFFSGWPELSSGTFSGVVQAMDAVTQADGSFRALVVADTSTGRWPDPSVLRQGVRVRAWVLGERVPLGYELWRVFNGFPPDMPRMRAPTGPNLVGIDDSTGPKDKGKSK